MVVVYMIPADQRAIETVASMDTSHSDIYLDTPYFFTFCSTELMVRCQMSQNLKCQSVRKWLDPDLKFSNVLVVIFSLQSVRKWLDLYLQM